MAGRGRRWEGAPTIPLPELAAIENDASGEIVWRNDIPGKWDQRSYLYPIAEPDLLTNPALKQNPGW